MTMKTSIKKFALGLSAATLAIGGVAYAQAPTGKPGMDANSDGTITRAEAQSSAAAMFARMDVNKDGKIDKTDREARRTEMRGKMFDRLDADNNGSISKTEFMADRGGDGDACRGMHKMGKDGDGKRGPGMAGAGKGMRHAGKGHHGGMMMMAKMADTDNDGAISQAEFTAAAMKHFDMMDANKDGQVTKEERQASREKMKAEWQAKRADWKAKADAR
jgi:hypothetical protein